MIPKLLKSLLFTSTISVALKICFVMSLKKNEQIKAKAVYRTIRTNHIKMVGSSLDIIMPQLLVLGSSYVLNQMSRFNIASKAKTVN